MQGGLYEVKADRLGIPAQAVLCCNCLKFLRGGFIHESMARIQRSILAKYY